MISFSQILLVVLVGFLLFGNLPKKVQEISKAIKVAKKEFSKEEAGKKEEISESKEKEKLLNFP